MNKYYAIDTNGKVYGNGSLFECREMLAALAQKFVNHSYNPVWTGVDAFSIRYRVGNTVTYHIVRLGE